MPEHHFWVVLAFGALVLVLQNGFGYITDRLSLIVQQQQQRPFNGL